MTRLDKVIQSFSQAVHSYDSFSWIQQMVADALAQRVIGLEPKGGLGTVLEIGCGTGFLSRHLAPLAEFYVLTDISLPLLKLAYQKVNFPQVSPLVVDGENLCFSASFDLISSNLALHWCPNLKKTIAGLVASLKPEGRLSITIFGNNSFHEWRAIHDILEVPCGLLPLPSLGQIRHWLPTMGDCHIQEEWIKVKTPNALSFLGAWKKMGIHLGHPNHAPLSPGRLRKIMRIFDQSPYLSCQIFYITYQKPEKMREE